MMLKPLSINLTKKQQELVKPLLEEARSSCDAGKKGMIVAQVFADRMTVGFITHDKAKYLVGQGTASLEL